MISSTNRTKMLISTLFVAFSGNLCRGMQPAAEAEAAAVVAPAASADMSYAAAAAGGGCGLVLYIRTSNGRQMVQVETAPNVAHDLPLHVRMSPSGEMVMVEVAPDAPGIDVWRALGLHLATKIGERSPIWGRLSFAGTPLDPKELLADQGVGGEAVLDCEYTYSWTPASNDALRCAVHEWVQDRAGALKKYGHIEHWNTSRITDMKYLYV